MSMPTQYQPVRVPDWVWQRPETLGLLNGRDIGGLFRLAQQYSGASQARIAAAVGISQGRVNEIANGRRCVTNLEVLTRIADGLHMPDEARITMGLAPTRPDTASLTTLSGEVARVYASQQQVADIIRRRAQEAATLDILAVRALGIVGLNDSLVRPALTTRTAPLQIRVVLLDPDCPAALQRAGEIGESPTSFTAGIHLSIAKLQEVADTSSLVDLEVRLSARLPVWRIIRFDDVQYVSAFDAAWEGHESAVYEIPCTPRGVFWAGFRRLFEDARDNSRVVIGGAECNRQGGG